MLRLGDEGKHDMHVVSEYTKSSTYCAMFAGGQGGAGRRGRCSGSGSGRRAGGCGQQN